MHEPERDLTTKDVAPRWSRTHAERMRAGGCAHALTAHKPDRGRLEFHISLRQGLQTFFRKENRVGYIPGTIHIDIAQTCIMSNWTRPSMLISLDSRGMPNWKTLYSTRETIPLIRPR